MKGFNRVEKNPWFRFQTGEERSTRANTAVEGKDERRKVDVMVKEKANLEVRRNFYTMRAKRLWSRVPKWVEQVKSVNAFKNAHDRWIEKGGNPNDRDMYNAD